MKSHKFPDAGDMRLDELQDLFDKETDGTLFAKDREALQALLAQPANRLRYQTWVRVARAGAALSEARPAKGFTDRVMARLAEPLSTRESPLQRFLVWCTRPRTLRWNPLALAGAGALAAGALFLIPRSGPPPDASPIASQAPSEAGLARVRLVYHGSARRVSVAGSFNAWSVDSALMTEVRPGVWTADLPLAPGRYEYSFVLDGSRWVPDPAAPVHVDDGFGQTNGRLEI